MLFAVTNYPKAKNRHCTVAGCQLIPKILGNPVKPSASGAIVVCPAIK